MSQDSGQEPVTVTADARPHPAVRALARASILLARQQVQAELSSLSGQATAVTADSAEQGEVDHE